MELQKLAEESQSNKDELDVLRHVSDKVVSSKFIYLIAFFIFLNN